MNSPTERPVVLHETGANESFLLGTRDQLLEFANSIIRLLNEPKANRQTWHEIETFHPICKSNLTDSMGEVVIDGLVVVNSESDRRTLMNGIRVNCGDLPVDWDGYDQARSKSD